MHDGLDLLEALDLLLDLLTVLLGQEGQVELIAEGTRHRDDAACAQRCFAAGLVVG